MKAQCFHGSAFLSANYISNIKSSNSLSNEVTTKEIGELVMEKLKKKDGVAYVRFASVYREFKDLNTFLDELKQLQSDK